MPADAPWRRPSGARTRRQRRLHRALGALPWLLFGAWMLVQVPAALRPQAQGVYRVDFLTYRRAADALASGRSPYAHREEALAIWRRFHQDETELLAAAAHGAGPAALRAQQARPTQPGPYLYPPTLALLVSQLDAGGPAFSLLSLLAVAAFAGLWLRAAGLGSGWLLLLAGSWDLLATATGGNVELLVLAATLAAARLLWAGRRPAALAAAAPVALVLLVKPFYALVFAALGGLRLAGTPRGGGDSGGGGGGGPAPALRSLAAAAAGVVALVGLEVIRWGPRLQPQALDYAGHALESQWFVLPLDEQTPMSAWNRTAMQALVNAGVPAAPAQAAGYGLWLLAAGATAALAWSLWRRRCRQAQRAPVRPVPFPLAFALAFVLLYWGRPVGWTFVYLELVLVGGAWPWLRKRERVALLAALVGLMASHWAAVARTSAGLSMAFLTLQTARVPWETWLVLPACWLVLLRALVRSAGR